MEEFDDNGGLKMTHHKPEMLQWRGYFPGVIGQVTALHGVYFNEKWGFDVSFEAQVGKEISEFIIQFQEYRDNMWFVSSGDTLAGCAVVDGSQADSQGARLRWFMVAPQFQGHGLGRALLDKAVEFCCKAGYCKIYLWTFEGLDAARFLFNHSGFQLCDEIETDQWGRGLIAQKFELDIAN
jgi:GNAT superfamily N-acetyltransferase